MRHVIQIDQFYGPSPYKLQQQPVTFEALEAHVASSPELFGPEYRRPQILDVPETYRPPMAWSVYAADEHGMAFVWRMNWDSSG